MVDKRKIKAFKFFRPKDGYWAIILGEDEYVVQELYMEEQRMSKEKFDRENIRKEQLRPSYKIPSIWSGSSTTIGALINTIKFFPRCVLESDDLADLRDYYNKSE